MAIGKRKKERVNFNISGEKFETYQETLTRFPETLLGNYDEMQSYYEGRYNEYYFDRCRLCFESILFFHQSNGLLSCPMNVVLDKFISECEFFRIPNDSIVQLKIKEGRLISTNDTQTDSPNVPRMQKDMWAFLDCPESSEAARVYAIVSFHIIMISISCACLETIPALHVSYEFGENPWAIAELVLNIWFLVEFLARLVISPDKVEFVSSSLNWIDCGASVPYFVVPVFSDTEVINYGFLRVLKFVRVMRLFRLSKHSKRLKVVGEIIKSCVPDFQLLLLCFGIAIIFGGSFVYFTERTDDTTDFISIPSAFWWAIQAVTTLGYGDIVPQTLIGRLVAAMYSILGVMTLSLPVLAIVRKFTMFYEKNVECNPWD